MFLSGIVGSLMLALATPSFGADSNKEIKITGDAKCAKCSLKEGDKCQTVIQTEGNDGKKVTYYLADTEAAKGFHHEVCSGKSKKVTATGTAKKADGKQEFAASKIEVNK